MLVAALASLFTRRRDTVLERAPAARAEPRPLRAPSRCFEVLVPYHDELEAERAGVPADARHALVVEVWAPDVSAALDCAHERFLDHRRTHGRAARIAPGGPIALRIARETEARFKVA